jgi:hypothetical protein
MLLKYKAFYSIQAIHLKPVPRLPPEADAIACKGAESPLFLDSVVARKLSPLLGYKLSGPGASGSGAF